jgi:hypothetical protein
VAEPNIITERIAATTTGDAHFPWPRGKRTLVLPLARVLVYAALTLEKTAVDQNLTAIERAFQIARSGKARTPKDIKKLLIAEGYSVRAIIGPSLSKQLRELMDLAARSRCA